MVKGRDLYDNGLETLLDKTSKNGLKVQAYNRKTQKIEDISLSYLSALKLKLNGFVKIGERQYEGWSGAIPFYIYTCKSNGKKIFMLDYPHGYEGRLDCKL
ncbi:MAG: hypothetical protein OH338_02870 [Candidatus Parvarchaeota archaeon]|nr:hypothetical protein [Candidatus Parvarchaeota archaeon]MCW1294904.1 hypothetical protein [Candidatus Parvarchaeum tengchongense]MCW1295841.1 hypothetical protein [Candidatus Parvarchaeum tengchongense]MCW1298992.1 hypothetical protein [Candidatus Parvarchaeum tengchongense]MCW1312346.1 hypothetical protein [Candidatus Parvarchaeum tengchongense]